jgi:hypothetical protein
VTADLLCFVEGITGDGVHQAWTVHFSAMEDLLGSGCSLETADGECQKTTSLQRKYVGVMVPEAHLLPFHQGSDHALFLTLEKGDRPALSSWRSWSMNVFGQLDAIVSLALKQSASDFHVQG